MIANVRRRATSLCNGICAAARVVAVEVSVSSGIVGDAGNQRRSHDNRSGRHPQNSCCAGLRETPHPVRVDYRAKLPDHT